jgi:hypothetical protein
MNIPKEILVKRNIPQMNSYYTENNQRNLHVKSKYGNKM